MSQWTRSVVACSCTPRAAAAWGGASQIASGYMRKSGHFANSYLVWASTKYTSNWTIWASHVSSVCIHDKKPKVKLELGTHTPT
eukprot:2999758-Pleurochrysis_carterae.AAC.5